MIASTERFSIVAALALLGVTTGCQQNATTAGNNDRGTYTAARHRQLGSNIPQPDSADTVNSRYDPDIGSHVTAGRSTIGGGTR